MVAALLVAIALIKQSFVCSQETIPGFTCGASKKPDECVVGPGASALLQVDRAAKKADFDRSHIHDPDSSPVSREEMLRHTKPLRSQIDDLNDRVESLEATAGQRGSQDRQDDGEDSRQDSDNWAWDNYDEDHDAVGDSDKRSEKDGEEPRRRRRKEADDKTEGNELSSEKQSQPDWNGVAPNAWNGLEKVKAKDRGRQASWKGKGTGVSSGRKYSGEYPYEIMMDVDYIIDSNPSKSQPTQTEESGGESKVSRKKEEKSGGKEGGKGKSAPKHGSKKATKAPKAQAKSGPRHGGKSSKREGGKAKGDAAVGGKFAPSGKSSASEQSSIRRPAAVSKTASRNGGKEAPEALLSRAGEAVRKIREEVQEEVAAKKVQAQHMTVVNANSA